MPGDVVLGRDGGVLFIPPQLAEQVVKTSEVVRLRDMFGHERLREGNYTAGQIDTRWTDAIEKDFSQWLRDNIDKLPVPEEQIRKSSRNAPGRRVDALEAQHHVPDVDVRQRVYVFPHALA